MAKDKNKAIGTNLGPEEKYYARILLALCITQVAFTLFIAFGGIPAGAYFFSAYRPLGLVLTFPLAVAVFMMEAVQERVRGGQFKNGKHLYNAAVVQMFFYVLIVGILGVSFSENLMEDLYLGRYGFLVYFMSLVVFGAEVFFMLIRGYLNTIKDKTPTGNGLLVRQLFFVILIFLSAALIKSSGSKAAELLKSREVAYAYSASGAAIGLALSAILGVFFYAISFILHKKLIRRMALRDKNPYRENSGFIMIRGGLSYFIALLPFSVFEIVMQYTYLSSAGTRNVQGLRTYHWGLWCGAAGSSSVFPLVMVLLLALKSYGDIRKAYKHEAFSEIRFRCMGLLKTAGVVAILFGMLLGLFGGGILREIFRMESSLGHILFVIRGISLVPMALTVIYVITLCGEKHFLFMAGNGAVSFVLGFLTWGLSRNLFPASVIAVALGEGVFYLFYCIFCMVYLGVAEGFTPAVPDTILKPLGCDALAGIPAFGLYFGLGLILPGPVPVLLGMLVYFYLAGFIAARFHVFDETGLKKIPLGKPLGRLLKKIKVLPA